MSTDMRARYLNQRVMTATPAQRVVMLYDRLSLDLARAAEAATESSSDLHFLGENVDHAMQIVAELAGSLNASAGGPAENLASLYGYLLGELSAVRSGQTDKIPGTQAIVGQLREAWAQAVTVTATPAAAGAWVG